MKSYSPSKEKKVWVYVFAWKISILMVSFFWLYPNFVMAGSLTLSWSPNSESDLAGYKVYLGTASKTYGTPIDVKNVTTYTASGLEEKKTYYFAVTAYDQAGNESAFSNEVFGIVPDKTPPAAPTGLLVK